MLVFFDYDFPAVSDNVLEKIISALLEVQRMELMVNGIPVVFIRDSFNIIITGVVYKQRLRYLYKNIVLFRHKSLRIKESDLSGHGRQTRRNGYDIIIYQEKLNFFELMYKIYFRITGEPET